MSALSKASLALLIGSGVVPAFADTGLYAFVEIGANNLTIDMQAQVRGVPTPLCLTCSIYSVADTSEASLMQPVVGGGYNLQLGEGPFSVGIESFIGFVDNEERFNVSLGSERAVSFERGCFAPNPDGSCPPGTLLPSRREVVDDRQLFAIVASVDYTAAAMIKLNYRLDALKFSVGAGPAWANVNTSYRAEAFTTPLILVNAFNIILPESGLVTFPAESLDQAKTLTGTAVRIAVDYDFSERLTAGVQFEAADYGSGATGGNRVPALNLNAEDQSATFRITARF